jgi:hypothetical protein
VITELYGTGKSLGHVCINRADTVFVFTFVHAHECYKYNDANYFATLHFCNTAFAVLSIFSPVCYQSTVHINVHCTHSAVSIPQRATICNNNNIYSR